MINTAEALYQAIQQIPMPIRITLKRETFTPYINDIIGLATVRGNITYGKLKPNNTIEKIWIDNVGYMHETGEIERIGSRIKLETTKWETKKGDVRLVGPKLTSFPANTEWKIGKSITRLDKLTIKKVLKPDNY